MDSNEQLSKVPWVTNDGCVDLKKFPIDGVLQQAIDRNAESFRSGVNMLRSMHSHGRQEAGVFLLGLLVACDDIFGFFAILSLE